MGAAKAKQYSRQTFLKEHTRCCYCGAPATTTDHCPPRCFFPRREWPEGYEFPACKPCNDEARLDEQALGVIVRIDALKNQPPSELQEWMKLVQGTRNNQPAIVEEWMSGKQTGEASLLRASFGELGDRMRRAGYSSLSLGPLTREAMNRFTIKLTQALYYKHIGKLFDGKIYHRHVNLIAANQNPEVMATLINFAPMVVEPTRASRSLTGRFLYRLNYAPEPAVLNAACQFGDQIVLHMMAMDYDAFAGFKAFRAGQQLGDEEPPGFVDVPLRFRGTTGE
jgi:hypothetical protein